MSYTKHHVIIVTSFMKSHIYLAHAQANMIMQPLVTNVYSSPLNEWYTFFIRPDGSKENWKDSDDYNKKRKEFLRWMKKENNFCDYVEVMFGSDENEDIDNDDLKPKVTNYGYYQENED